MENIKLFFNWIIAFYQVEIKLYGYTFTFLDIFIFVCIVGIVFYVLGKIFF